mgnify:CR=1 FL=1
MSFTSVTENTFLQARTSNYTIETALESKKDASARFNFFTQNKQSDLTVVTVGYSEYNHRQWINFLKAVYQHFGRPGTNWHFSSTDYRNNDDKSKGHEARFYFTDPQDATVFSLKFL